MSVLLRQRLAFVAAALVTMGAGLAVHLGGAGLPFVVRDVAGDVLWAVMICWWIGAAAPGRSRPTRAGVAIAVCVTVELSQLYREPSLDALRRTTLGHLVLGSGFDPRDLVAYSFGVLGAWGGERLVRR